MPKAYLVDFFSLLLVICIYDVLFYDLSGKFMSLVGKSACRGLFSLGSDSLVLKGWETVVGCGTMVCPGTSEGNRAPVTFPFLYKLRLSYSTQLVSCCCCLFHFTQTASKVIVSKSTGHRKITCNIVSQS